MPRSLLLAGVGLCGLCGGAMAQETVPQTLDPTRVPQNFEQAPPLEVSPPISVPATEDNVAPANADELTFTYRGMRIEGARALPRDRLEELWSHAVGETVSVADIFSFANEISATYRQAGYALSFALVGRQTIEDGIFTIRVVEGFVERVAIDGQISDHVRTSVSKIANRITESRPLRSADIERYMLLINDLPGIDASAVLSPAKATGGALLSLDVDYSPVAASFGYNSFLPESLGRHVAEASLEMRGLWDGSEFVRLTGQRALVSDSYWSIGADASIGIGDGGLRFGASGFYSETDPEGALLDLLNYKGDTVNARVYAQYPVIRSREENLDIGLEFALDNAGSNLLGTRFFEDKLRPLSLWASYQFVDATRAVSFVKTTVTRGLRIMNASADSRANGVLDYMVAELDLQRNQPIGRLLSGSFFATFAVRGQMALNRGGLFSAAECSFGGRQFGRAFDAGIVNGEDCLQGNAELHWVRDVSLPGLSNPALFDLYGFIDGGFGWETGALEAGQNARASAASLGMGVNMRLARALSGLVEIGRQLALSHGETESGVRLTGAVSVRF